MNHGTRVTKVLGRARDLYEDSGEVARNGATRTKSFIHHRPVLSTLLGLGIGFLIGHWLRPKK
jgi:ElaB/YqjD/DUF883 family membrane-anchored ribosome-binding protein